MSEMRKENIRLLFGVLLVAILGLALYFFPLGQQLTAFAIKNRLYKVLAYGLVAAGVSFTTISFQTLVSNRFLTPSILGIDALYVLIQSCYFWFYWQFVGQESLNPIHQFVLVLLLQCVFFMLLQPLLRKLLSQGFLFILLICMALGSFFRSSATFIQVLMDPNEYDQLQSRLFPSFQRINEDVIGLVLLIIGILLVYLWKKSHVLDVLHLGKSTATILGLDVLKEERRLLWVIVIGQSALTALVGPLVYLGFMVSNLTYQLLKAYQHKQLFVVSSILGFAILLVGQMIVERIFQFDFNISMVVELLGGLFFFYLIFKERQSL